MDSRRLEENSVVEDTITDSGMGGGRGVHRSDRMRDGCCDLIG